MPLSSLGAFSAPQSKPKDTRINLLHMELFYHFVSHLQGTLAFPQVWPALLQRSFQVSIHTLEDALSVTD